MADLRNFRRHQTVVAGILGATTPEEQDRLTMRLLQQIIQSTPASSLELLAASSNGQLLVYNSTTGLWTPGTSVPDLSIGNLRHTGSLAGFYGATAIAKQTVVGAKGGNVALANLMTALAAIGLFVDNTT